MYVSNMHRSTPVGRLRAPAAQASASFWTRSVPMSSTYAPGGQSVDIGQILDDGPWTTMQKLVVILAALSIVADGFDGQLIGFAIPSIIKEWARISQMDRRASCSARQIC